MKAATATITPGTFGLLRELALHNDRPWFEGNKDRYLREVRDPLLRFVAAFAPRLARSSSHMVADPRPVGGSLFRIYREHFSKDKTPYKTHAGMSFRHVHGRTCTARSSTCTCSPDRSSRQQGSGAPRPGR